ncbi:MDR family MFS transporter [Nonomuraea jiangxiensis]|uniref:Drug resistance transporter, EmrB/QacA subfamily n=1 Tax=Nonomuraea jiangxiensis TaxID=633440 RepID=A0A1G9UHB2_9ACTN|nr:MDR family MFS transporter [Nonomuraea jiangxiensis]SDM58925.1 drug resistance transporter, EmrB/QacA subfamily [Nonomuraea jiangxiensis]
MPATPHPLTHRAIMTILVPLMLVLFITNLDQTITAAALPTIVAELGNAGQISWVASAYLLTSAVTTLLFGKLGDMFGRKPIFLISMVIFTVGSALAGAAESMLWLIVFRGLQGVGGGGLNSLVMAIVGDLVPARQRSRYQAYTGIVATLALIAGPFLGGLFSDTLSWRWIFYINIPICVLAIVMTALRVSLPRPIGRTRRVDVAGGLIAAVVTTAILLLTTLGGTEHPWSSPLIVALIGLSVAGLAAYILVERRAAEPITPLSLFRSSVFTICSIQFGFVAVVLFVAMLYVPLFLQTIQGYSAFAAGLFLIPMLLGLVAATAVAGPFIASTGRYKIYPVIGSAVTGVSMWVLTFADADTAAWAIVAPLVFAGAGMGLMIQVALLAGQNAVENRHLGTATGALNFFKSIGAAFGAAIFGAILVAATGPNPTPASMTYAFQTVFLWSVPFMVVSFVLALVMREKPLSEEMIEVAEGKVEVPEY